MPSGPEVTTTHGSGSPPTLTGGTIASGTYYLTASTLYGCAQTAAQNKETWVFTATTATSGTLQAAFDFGGPPQSESGTYTTSGSTITITPTCPAGEDVPPREYLVTSDGITTGQLVKGEDGGVCGAGLSTLSLQP